MLFPADPPRVEEIIAVMREAGDDRHGLRARALIAVLWRAALRLSKRSRRRSQMSVLAAARYSCATARATGGVAGMDNWGLEHLLTWLERRVELPVGPLLCVIDGSTRRRAWSATASRAEFRRLAVEAGVRRRFAPPQPRHAHAVELAREGVSVNIIQRQLGDTDLGTTSIYLQGIDPSEIINAVRARRQPMIPASTGLDR